MLLSSRMTIAFFFKGLQKIQGMKTMTCKQLGGACEKTFTAATFEEIAALSKEHGMAMFKKQDAAHLAAMEKMQHLMKDAEAMQTWYQTKRAAFNALPDNS